MAGERAYWDEQAEATASVFDAVQRLSYYLLRVNGTEAPEPEMYRRPGVVALKPEAVSLSDFNALLREG